MSICHTERSLTIAESERLGARFVEPGVAEFRVWAPAARSVDVWIGERAHPLELGDSGYHVGRVPASVGDRYLYLLDGAAHPDPCSCRQPDGARGPSSVIDLPRLAPGSGLRLDELVLYELHVGTFTREGTFDAVIPQLRRLRGLGVTAIELMPVATFPGRRNWGYDGLYLFAPHDVYGGPAGLARLVEAAHEAELGVVLDVVYNHIGPGTDSFSAFGPYRSSSHTTLWGGALDYRIRGVREWAIQNAELWVGAYGVDGLRLDAVHAIVDDSPTHVLQELSQRLKEINPRALVISETGDDDLRPLLQWGHDAIWLDRLHHELHVLLTGEHDGYYREFGTIEGLVGELTRERPERFVVCAQNHDQVGNRARGDRLAPAAHRVAVAIVLFSLSTPLLFMGEESGESSPFQFFTDHDDPELAQATREGRRREFARFDAFAGADLPDPQDAATFERSKVTAREPDPLVRALLALRPTLPRELEVRARGDHLVLRRGSVELVVDIGAQTVELRR